MTVHSLIEFFEIEAKEKTNKHKLNGNKHFYCQDPPLSSSGGALRDDPKNGCVTDYPPTDASIFSLCK